MKKRIKSITVNRKTKVRRPAAKSAKILAKPKKSHDHSWIMQVSGKSKTWWVRIVQELIQKHSRKTKDPWHGATNIERVVKELVQIIKRVAFRKKGRYDGNMRMAAVLSYVLAIWYLRIHRAKSYDPRRPVKARKAAYFTRLNYATALFYAIEDESMDPVHFPGQKWESPFDPYPTDGYFV